MGSIWRVEMLGTLEAKSEASSISRFRTRRVGLLLAYLAYDGRNHSRDELADMLWPELEADLARRNLRQALSSLRRHMEPPSVPVGAVLAAKQALVSLDSDLVTTDVAEFRLLLERAASPQSNRERIEKLKRAVGLYKGDLLPGYYEEWVQRERLNLEDLLVSALQNLIQACEAEGQIEEAIRYVRLALAKDHLQEDLHATLMRLYLGSERPASALQHFQEWKELLARELSDNPGREIQELAEKAQCEITHPSHKKKKALASKEAPVAFPYPEDSSHISRLPIQLTRYFGRSQDRKKTVEELADRRTRLVTLLGPAGTGKTRLSIEVGRCLSEEHGWNVWFVPLADFADGAMTLDGVLDALRLRNEAGSRPLDVLKAHLSGWKNLVILDNLEHILDEVAPNIKAILSDVPGLSILVTSRQSLKFEGEKEIDLATLPIPGEHLIESGNLHELSEVPSIQLFVDRAQANLPDFQVTRHNAQAIASICKKLDGLPLALEIAAGLSNAFTPSQILQNLENRLEVLRSRRRDISSRHRSLRAAIDYSYDLLSSELQSFFIALSVFRGGFTVEAALVVCLPESNGPSRARKRKTDECLRMILDLQDRSLLQSDDSGQGSSARFRLLESFREYGGEFLGTEEELALRRRHANYYLQPGKQPGLAGGERDNRLAALQFFLEQQDLHECIALLASLQTYSYTGREIIQAISENPRTASLEAIDQLAVLGMLAKGHRYASEYDESYRVCRRALDKAIEIDRKDQIAIFHQEVALALSFLGRREESIEHSQQNMLYGQETGNLQAQEIAHMNIGTCHWAMGNLKAALDAFEHALEISKRLLNGEPSWSVLYNLARVHLDSGNLDDGMQLASEGLRVSQHRGDEFGTSMCLSLISRYHRLRGNLIAALATSHEALVKRRKAGFLFWILNAIQSHASVLSDMGMYREASALLGASRGVTKLKREVDDREFAESLEVVKANLSEVEFEQAWAEGLAMNMEEAFRMAAHYR